ncbi:hypothetical protein [Lacticaseibacillus salsurivasis]|uniref:hypothetical protein n=1 Tax=Lacticaseibacillus salsurivasis TaxID=3081441 RepID=UPI0030C72D20
MTSEVKIRGISGADLSIIDTMAKEKAMSRSAYLRWLIHAHATHYYVDDDKQNMSEVLKQNEKILTAATEALNSFTKVLQHG